MGIERKIAAGVTVATSCARTDVDFGVKDRMRPHCDASVIMATGQAARVTYLPDHDELRGKLLRPRGRIEKWHMLAIAAREGRIWRCFAAMLLLPSMTGCSYESLGSIDQHYQTFGARTPENDKIFVCSAYGCRVQTVFRFTRTDIIKLQSLMAEPKKGSSPAEERRNVGRALAWMEKRVGDVVGTSADRPGDDFLGSGDPTQMDCVDVATNLTSYLLVLERNKLLRHHTVGTIFVKEDLRRGWSGWPHYAAIIVEHKSKQRFAVDGWKLASGEEPEIVEAEKWYIDDADIALKVPL